MTQYEVMDPLELDAALAEGDLIVHDLSAKIHQYDSSPMMRMAIIVSLTNLLSWHVWHFYKNDEEIRARMLEWAIDSVRHHFEHLKDHRCEHNQ